jgi:hypothetical protein
MKKVESRRLRVLNQVRLKVGARGQERGDPFPDPNHTVTLLTAPSLGQVSDDRQHPPGYFIAHFKEEAMVSLDRRAL